MPGPGGTEKWDFKPTKTEVEEVCRLFNYDFTLNSSCFCPEVSPFDPSKESTKRDLQWTNQPMPRRNKQTMWLCKTLGIRDPMDVVLNGKWPDLTQLENISARMDPESSVGGKSDEIDLPEESDNDEEEKKIMAQTDGAAASLSFLKASCPLKGPSEDNSYVVDTQPDASNFSTSWNVSSENSESGEPAQKKLKRRNVQIYAD